MKNKIISIALFLCVISLTTNGQSFLNGDFEVNSAGVDQINLTNGQYNSFMSNSIAFGNYNGGGPNGGNMDIVTSSTYCGLAAQQGDWYVCLTGGGTDAISLKLSTPLIAGNSYSISFYDRFGKPPATVAYPFQIGLSPVDTTFGTLLYTAPNADSCLWTLRSFSFIAPNNGQYVTAKLAAGGTSDTWCHLDNFTIMETTSIPDVNQNHHFQIYPNPAIDLINIQSKSTKETYFKIYNSIGQVVKTGLLQPDLTTIYINNLREGMYFIELTFESKLERQCFFVRK